MKRLLISGGVAASIFIMGIRILRTVPIWHKAGSFPFFYNTIPIFIRTFNENLIDINLI